MWRILIVILMFVAVYQFESWVGRNTQRKREAEIERLKSLPNYRRLVKFTTNSREYIAAVAEWDKEPGIAELWCVMGPNPDGYTYHFLWSQNELEFLS